MSLPTFAMLQSAATPKSKPPSKATDTRYLRKAGACIGLFAENRKLILVSTDGTARAVPS
jgi:hypothetical protein